MHYQLRCFAFGSPSATLSPPARRIPCQSTCRIASTSPQSDLPHLGSAPARGCARRPQKHASASRPRRSTEFSSGLTHPHLHAGRPCAISPRPLRLARSPATPPARMTNPPATSPATRLLVCSIAAAVTLRRAIPSPVSTPRTNITAAAAAAAHRARPHRSPVRASAQIPATLPPTPMILRIGSTAGGAAAGIRAASTTHSRPRTSVTTTPSRPRVNAIAAPTGTEELPGCPRQPADPVLPISPGQPPLALVCYAGYGRVSTLTLQNCLLPYRHQQSFSNRHYSGPPRTPRKMPSLLANAHDAPSPTSSPGWRPGISTWPFAWTPTHTWHKS